MRIVESAAADEKLGETHARVGRLVGRHTERRLVAPTRVTAGDGAGGRQPTSTGDGVRGQAARRARCLVTTEREAGRARDVGRRAVGEALGIGVKVGVGDGVGTQGGGGDGVGRGDVGRSDHARIGCRAHVVKGASNGARDGEKLSLLTCGTPNRTRDSKQASEVTPRNI